MKIILFKVLPQAAKSLRELYAPKYETDIDNSRKLGLGSEIVASSSKKDIRNVGHHRKYFALLKLAWENMPEKYSKLFANIEEFRTEVKMQIGCREKRVSISGNEYWIPKSMAFDSMGQEEFEGVYSKTLDFICEYILPGVSSDEIEAQIIDFF